jgi:2-polyprenyl-3-methyl-5-hydroxy-6-metoxy-1,4-benzoquinol methylase
MSRSETERYPVKTDRHSSHSQIVKQCGEGRGLRLLDIGCARGHLSAALASQGWQVTGIEYDAADAAIAQENGIDVIVGTAEDAMEAMNEKFDLIVFADVLEHFVHPEDVLSQARTLLAPGGRVVISIPNVAHLSVRLQLLMGSFNYTDRGILDRTHLHFYTKKTLQEMIVGAGLDTIYIGATPAPVEEVLPVLRKIAPLRLLLELNALIARTWKSAFAYQYIAVALVS